MQDRESLSINSTDTSISRSKQLESAVPLSKISALSSGEFVGMVADDPDCKIDLKTFHCEILNDQDALKKEKIVTRIFRLSASWTIPWFNATIYKLNRMFRILFIRK